MSSNSEILLLLESSKDSLILSSQAKLAQEDKPCDHEDKTEQPPLTKAGDSQLVTVFATRRNSAFSIYDPKDEEATRKKDDSQSDSESDSEQSHKRVWKREKKDKKLLNRLQTKNLNRYFRSKINQMLREMKQNPSSPAEATHADRVLEILNKKNQIMFKQIREIIKDPWLQGKLLECSGVLLKYIHKGKMGMQSKLIMLKYFNKILRAIRNPDTFTCWK